MKRSNWAFAATAAGLFSLGGGAAFAADAQPEVRYMGDEAVKLVRMSADGKVGEEAIAARAREDFERVPEVGTINIRPPVMHQWMQPSYKKKDCQCDGTIDSITTVGKRALLDNGGVPSPLSQETLQKLMRAAEMGDALQAGGKVEFDHKGFLNPNMLGAYVYMKDHPIGVEFNAELARVSRKAGDLLAWFTFIHEYLHAYMDLVLKQLTPEQARLGEQYAFLGQAQMWEHVDPNGEMISVLYHDFVENGDDPELAQIVKHNVALRSAYRSGTIPQFVDSLGYEDEPAHGR